MNMYSSDTLNSSPGTVVFWHCLAGPLFSIFVANPTDASTMCLASYPGPWLAFHHLQYDKEREGLVSFLTRVTSG